MNALCVQDLTKVYPGFTLDHVSFQLKEGHIAGLIGRNGAGKTTVLKGILRLISAQGKIEIFGKDITGAENEVKEEIGYVGGGFRHYPLKTLRAVRKSFSRFYPQWNANKYDRYLRLFQLNERKKVKELSEGMKVKFALALALSHNAKLLIMDEPTSGLDPVSREEFCDIVLSLVREESVSVLFSTHITSDLERIADDIIYLSQGQILAECALSELLNRYVLIRFESAEQAKNAGAIGIKQVKEGWEGIHFRQSSPSETEIIRKNADLNDIMIHLEIAAREQKIC